MDTAEARTTTSGAAGGPVYDAFLSYSHAADELLAPRLQSGLQRFAKPWWKRRALRIFRDEASLSANPHLWSSITDALDDSGWFILLLSPDAADSEWVNREVEYWLDQKDPNRIIPVVTEGDFTWYDNDFISDAAPPALGGAFSDEPRWVDLRFARSEEQLDLKNPRFSAAVADIASAVRGVPKDELESEEVRQHRRTTRTVWAAGVVVLLFAVFSATAALFALDQRNEAQAERDRAVIAEEAATAAAEAEAEQRLAAEEAREAEAEQRVEADRQAGIAQQSALLARSRELAAASLLNLDVDPERSLLLALEGVDTAAAVAGTAISEPVTALHQALAASRVVLRNPGGWFVESSPDGSLLATGLTNDSDTEDAVIWEAATSRQIRVLPSADGRSAWTAAFSSDGHSLAVGYEAAGASGPLVVVWEVSTGEVIATFDDPDFNNTGEVDLSADGELLTAVAWGDAGGAVMVWDLDSGAERYRIESVEAPSFSPDGRLLAVAGPTGVTLFDAATGTEAASLEVPADLSLVTTAFDPSGRYLAAVSQFPPVVVIWEIASGEVTASWESGSGPVGLEWNPSGDLIAVSGNDGTPRLYDLTGDEVLSLLGHDSIVWSLAFNPSGDRLAGAGLFGDTLIWDVRPSPTRETATLTTPYPGLVWIVYSTDGDSIVALSDEGGTGATMERMNADTGLVLATMPDQRFQWPAQPIPSPEAELVTSLNTDGSAALNDLQTFEPIISLPEDRYALAVSHDGTRVVLNPIVGEGDAIVAEVGSWEVLATFEPQSSAVFSPDGDLLLGYHGGTGVSIGLFDVATGSSLVNDLGGFAGNFSPDGTVLTAHTPTGGLRLLDVASLQADETAEQALVWEITAHNGPIFSSWFSPDSSLIATMAGDSQLRVWDTRNGNLVADFGTMGGSFPAFHFHPDGKHLIAEDTEGTIQILTLDLDELVDIAISRLTRGFSEGECVTYRIDPCPTLEDIQSGSA